MFKQKNEKQMVWRVALIILAAIIGIHLLTALTLDRVIQYTETSFVSEKLAPELDGYTIAFITDTHITPDGHLQQMVERVNKRGVDLLLLGGDISREQRPGDTNATYIETLEPLSRIHTADGIYGVQGNHDQADKLFAAMESCGMIPLDNAGVQLHKGLYLSGIADPMFRRPDISRATAGAQPDDFVLLLSHQPDLVMQPEAQQADLMLSGHTHGGHISLFGLWAPQLPRVTQYADRLGQGWATGSYGTPIYVSRGNGYLYGIPRVFSRPEIVFLTLHSK